jgi:endonuclease G, mitochondrial
MKDGMLFKTGLFAALAGVAYFLFNFLSGKKPDENAAPQSENRPKTESPQPEKSPAKTQQGDFQIEPSDPTFYEPTSTTHDIVRHKWFSLSYSEENEQAEWVAYELTRERLNANFATRSNTFMPDPDVKTESATPRDYAGSGYDKGHLCPAADMGFDSEAMDQTFYMSNMSPQKRVFNVGVWRELEENTRDWARRFRQLYIVTGPIFQKSVEKPIGFSKVTVPAYFYKVILAGEKSIAFVIPNDKSDRPLMDYATTIDNVERITGIDFFPQILKGANEAIEAKIDKTIWEVDVARFSKRVSDWNLK